MTAPKKCPSCKGSGYVRREFFRPGSGHSVLTKVCRCKAGRDVDLRNVVGLCGEVLPRRGKVGTD